MTSSKEQVKRANGKDKPRVTSMGKRPSDASSSVGGKKMSSLSSHQATLSFSALPMTSVPKGPLPTRRPQNGSSSARPLGPTSSAEDRRLMPPPATIPIRRAATSRTPSPTKKNRAIGLDSSPIEVLSDSEEEEEVSSKAGPSRGLWTDRYAPDILADLAPGKQRVARVKGWLYEALHGDSENSPVPDSLLAPTQVQTRKDKIRKYKRILFLSGPAGAGKTTTVKLVARELGVELVEWDEGTGESTSAGGYSQLVAFNRRFQLTSQAESAITKLSSFLNRQSYQPLALSPQSSRSARPRALLLSSIPNTSHIPTREAFHAALLDFCRSYTSASCPLIIVHSDAGSSGRAEDSWMDRDRSGREGALEVLGKEVKDGPWCQDIDFLPLAPTFVTKALKRVVVLAIPAVGDRPPDSALQLIALSCHGDLRSAINSLQMLCSQRASFRGKKRRRPRDADDDDHTETTRKKGRGGRGGKGGKVDVSDDLRAVLDAVTRREQSLNLFHALGKIFYNKRLGDPNEDDQDQEEVDAARALPASEPLPRHLRDFERQTSLIRIEDFIPTIPIDASTLALWLHQSVGSFCTEVEQTAQALDDLCAADIMKSEDDIWQSSPQAIAYALHLTIRGCLMALPTPVPRRNQKVLKPHFFESFRKERDNATLLDSAAAYIAKKGAIESTHLAEHDAIGAPWGGTLSKAVLAKEVLPMMTKMQRFTNKPLLPVSAKALTLAPWASSGRDLYEDVLTSTSTSGRDETYDEAAAGEDGSGGVPHSAGWDEAADVVEEEEDGLAEDDIEDFD